MNQKEESELDKVYYEARELPAYDGGVCAYGDKTVKNPHPKNSMDALAWSLGNADCGPDWIGLYRKMIREYLKKNS